MISTGLMIAVVVILAATFSAVRKTRRRQAELEQDNDAMKAELDRHRQALQSILRELQNP